jgi:hypothetical protein
MFSTTRSLSEEEDVVSFDEMDIDDDNDNPLEVSFDERDLADIDADQIRITHENVRALAAIGAFAFGRPRQEDSEEDEEKYGADAGFTSAGKSWR